MSITHRRSGDLVTITLDDGKVNALGTASFTAIDAALDAEPDAAAVVLTGRAGVFTAGLDRTVIAEGGQPIHDLLVAFARTALRLWLEPRPVVVAATGHAVAAGTILAMAADHAVAADDDRFRWGLNEVSIGMTLPQWVLALARANVRADRLEDLLLAGALVDPASAVEAGFADETAPAGEVTERAEERARALAALPAAAFAATKRRLRGAVADALVQGIDADTRDLLAVVR